MAKKKKDKQPSIKHYIETYRPSYRMKVALFYFFHIAHHYLLSERVNATSCDKVSITCDRSVVFSGYSGFLHQ
jgi:hypothetical protein